MKISGTVSEKKSTVVIRTVISAFVWLAVWQIAYITVNREVLIASPFDVLKRICELAVTGDFWQKTLNSLFSILKGYIIAVVTGVTLAVATSASKTVYALFSPLLNIIRATPVASFIILALVWMTKADVPVFISFLMVMPIVWANMTLGINETDKQLLEFAKVYKLKKSEIVKKIYLPSVMPAFLSCVTTGIGFAWKSGIAAEVLSTPKNSIGTELYNSKVYLETVDLFAWTVVVIILSIILEKLFVYLINTLVRKKQGVHHVVD